VPRDTEKPGRERRQIPAVPVPRAPRLLERPGSEILGVRGGPEPIPEEVVDARKLIGIHRVPIGIGGRNPSRQPPGHRLFNGHLWEIYGARARVSHPGCRADRLAHWTESPEPGKIDRICPRTFVSPVVLSS